MKQQKKYKNIIFDLGGVLVNWKPREIIEEIFKNKECMPWKNWYNIINSAAWNEMEQGFISLKECIEKLSKSYDLQQLQYFFKHEPNYLFPLRGGIKILNQIKIDGYKTYILSNFGKDLFEQASKIYDYQDKILNKFDGIVISYEVKEVKPQPKIYKILLKKYNLNPNESLFLDDTQENLDTAKGLGIDVIWYKNYYYAIEKLKYLKII